MKLLVLFLDGFHPDYLRNPRAATLRQLAEGGGASELQPVLGYSNANRASLFTGEDPAGHDQWSYFRYDPEGSPFRDGLTRSFRWIDHVPSDLARKALKFGLSKTIVRRSGRARGYPNLSWENVPIRYLSFFDHGERALLDDPETRSLFSIARRQGLAAEWVDLPWGAGGLHVPRVRAALRRSDVVVAYNANMDAAGHWFGPAASRRFNHSLARTDTLAARVAAAAKQEWGPDHAVALVSDHGMAPVHRHVDLLRIVERLPGAMTRFVPFVDSTMARFWFENETGRREVEHALDREGGGRFLARNEMETLGIAFPHRGYGDAIYLLDPGSVFYPAHVSWVRPRGMHGYDPRDPTQTAVFALNDGRGLPARIQATDVLPRLLDVLGLPGPRRGPAGVPDALAAGVGHHGHGH